MRWQGGILLAFARSPVHSPYMRLLSWGRLVFSSSLCSSLLALATACGDDVTTPPADTGLGLETVATGLQFPLLVTAPLSDPSRLFVVEKGGIVRVIRNGTLLPTPFLDIRTKVSTGGEQGLLGLAFHSRYDSNRLFVISYTNTVGDTRISTMRVSNDPDVADAASESVFLSLQQPFPNHNGGHVTFGPLGFLFIGLGDGGGAGDPDNRAGDPSQLFGKLLRLNVDDDGTVRIPVGNPLVGLPSLRAEIWSIGLRNPWRFTFDRLTGDLYIGDVGQDRQEEIDVVTGLDGAGRRSDFGWSVMEGNLCFKPATNCNPDDGLGLTPPVLVYDQSQGCSVIGGHVYRGPRMPERQGTYFYGDLCGGWVRSFRYLGGEPTQETEWPALGVPQITSFGEDAAGELYVVSGTGTVYRIVPK